MGNLHAAEGGACSGGCPPGASCCDTSKSVGGAPGGCLKCNNPETACCIVGGGIGCLQPGQCCSDAECTGGQVCSGTGGHCSCPAGQTLCGGQCVDTNFNDNNCGVCGNVCPGFADTCCSGKCVFCPIFGGSCVSGQQECACPPGQPDTCFIFGPPAPVGICTNLKQGGWARLRQLPDFLRR